MDRPLRVAHADWSKNPLKRWVTYAERAGDGYRIHEPQPAAGLPDADFTGFDFPIGVPSAWAALAGIGSFNEGLRTWSADFYEPCERADQISVSRPFYPARPGGTSPKHLEAVFGSARLRRCDRLAKAAELFWLVGAKHPGHAAIAGWRDVLAPAVRAGQIALWPFDGSLGELAGRRVVAEVYPAETYRWLGIPTGFGKRDRAARATQAHRIRAWADTANVRVDADLDSGLPTDDAFDSLLGIIGMLEVVLGRRASGEPDDPTVRDVEGWILGLGCD